VIARWTGAGWEGVARQPYKDSPGAWEDVARHVLFDSDASAFQTRYFEVGPGGYTSFERHRHEHCVVVLSGHGRVRLGEEWHSIGPRDVVRVPGGAPHRFCAGPDEPLGLLCIVDRERDPPELLGNAPQAEASV
jgi:quercetin dioxygenase-like cupin family protein